MMHPNHRQLRKSHVNQRKPPGDFAGRFALSGLQIPGYCLAETFSAAFCSVFVWSSERDSGDVRNGVPLPLV
jgi:hypothetical protein